jgi:hypothetical protein
MAHFQTTKRKNWVQNGERLKGRWSQTFTEQLELFGQVEGQAHCGSEREAGETRRHPSLHQMIERNDRTNETKLTFQTTNPIQSRQMRPK